MTAVTTGAVRAAGHGGRWFPCTAMVARRAVLMTARTPAVVVMALVQSVVFLLIFRYVFGGAIASAGVPYVDFMVPGLLVASVLFSVMRTGAAIAEDLTGGVIDRFRSLPVPPSVVLSGRAIGDHALTLVTLLVTTGVAFGVGFRARQGFAGVAGLFGLCLLAAVAFTWVFLAAGLAVANVQAAQGLGFLVLPLTFVSSACVPVTSMPGWLRTFAMHQPVTVIIEACRYLSQGPAGVTGLPQGGGHYVTAAIAWCAGILALAVTAALAVFRRRQK